MLSKTVRGPECEDFTDGKASASPARDVLRHRLAARPAVTIKARRGRQGKLRLPAPASPPRDPLPKARCGSMPPVPGSFVSGTGKRRRETRNEKDDRRMT
ncbi:hypothetical protein MPL1032_140080 [Mesorhizobium plurifarium]|uniref:Uncharacterized protein n=1 Tax=Mesorhizobium plurifarium TaxID=69974 RepID=A0A0K2VS17_MESPL|nr:hypothetical protein MPL1032_140080 [Mesorhizobium plurifarium]